MRYILAIVLIGCLILAASAAGQQPSGNQYWQSKIMKVKGRFGVEFAAAVIRIIE
jgi:hypothetical protein